MDVKKSCAAVIGRVIFIGFCVQIALGILWMCNAFAGLQGFGEGIVCVGQMVLLGGGIFLVLCGDAAQRETDRTRMLFSVAVALSFPMVLQSLMKPDPRVLVTFFLLLGLRFCKMVAHPDRILLVVSVVLAVGMIAGTASERDLLALSGSRFVWTTLYQDYDELTDEEQDKMDYTVMVESTYEATDVETILIPDMRSVMEEHEVRAIVRHLIGIAWREHKRQIIKEILWDEAGHLCPALVVPLQLEHRAYDSRTGLNYRQFLQPAPMIGRYAMRYGCFWFVVAFILRGILWLLGGCPIGDKRVLIYAVLTVAGLSCWYTFSTAGRMDYKNVVYILCVWLLWMTDLRAIDLRTERQKEGMLDGGRTEN
ncbi:MAG: hypothetical protein IJ794_16205 [Lachnospiraceae bacterium]|nr:hypothetical protein [Lachnospiraceae bacterium]